MPYLIEQDVPMPQPQRNSKYPFAAMEIGDSFLADNDLARVSRAALHYAERHPGYKFACRKMGDGTRCWRIALPTKEQGS